VSILILALGSATALSQSNNLKLPETVEAGSAFSIQTVGNGKATLYIVGPAHAVRQEVQLGTETSVPAASLYNAGRYVAVLTSDAATYIGTFDVVPLQTPAALSFLAKPSRLPIGLRDGISGTVYVFDSYRNLIVTPSEVTFELSNPAGGTISRGVRTQNGVASIQMDSTTREGKDTFVVRAGDLSATRVIGQVPGDPCSLKINVHPAKGNIEIETDPVLDCSGNMVPDGTIVTFTEVFAGTESTVDVPLKRGIAKAELPAHPGATISVASGVVLGNQIRWEK
jgi:hypothetical protein